MDKPSFPRRRALPICLSLACLCAVSCDGDNNEGYVYPSLLTEFAVLYTDEGGAGTRFTTDNGETYAANTPIQGLQAQAAYRVVCGYEPTGENRSGVPVARIYTLESAVLLSEETGTSTDDPTGVEAVWRGAEYLNLQLTPKTQGGTQEWAYRTDSVTASSGGATHHLSLCHRQPGDPYSYSVTVYASLPLRPMELQTGDSITLTILTFDGRKTWRFAY